MRQLLLFSSVGAIGFVADTAALYLAVSWLGVGLYGGRAISYLIAATITWTLNRRITFPERRSASRMVEWLRFLAANAIGGLVNYATCAFLVSGYSVAAAYPVLAVAAGSIAGLTINFSLCRRLVFLGSRAGS